MRIWHLNLTRTDLRVDGIAVAIRSLARAQEEAGADTVVFGGGAATVDVVTSRLEDEGERPDIVHFHSVFRPLHALVARRLDKAGVPYVVSPHSGYAAESLARRRTLKRTYASVVERRFVAGAAGASCLTPVEESDLRAFAPRFDGGAVVVPNPVGVRPVDRKPAGPAWPERNGPPTRLVTLCRYDVRQKGLDRLADMARHLPEADFIVYGEQDKNEAGLTERVRRGAPPNFCLKPSVFGADKEQVLAEATLFVLASRWEGLSMSLAEALSRGVPCAVSQYVARTLPFAREGLGLVLNDEPADAARQLHAALADRSYPARWSAAGAAYAARNFAPSTVAERSLAAYESVLAGHRSDVGATR
ncbi:MAG: glycosyltransferase [Acidimicrobiales bacterium]